MLPTMLPRKRRRRAGPGRPAGATAATPWRRVCAPPAGRSAQPQYTHMVLNQYCCNTQLAEMQAPGAARTRSRPADGASGQRAVRPSPPAGRHIHRMQNHPAQRLHGPAGPTQRRAGQRYLQLGDTTHRSTDAPPYGPYRKQNMLSRVPGNQATRGRLLLRKVQRIDVNIHCSSATRRINQNKHYYIPSTPAKQETRPLPTSYRGERSTTGNDDITTSNSDKSGY